MGSFLPIAEVVSATTNANGTYSYEFSLHDFIQEDSTQFQVIENNGSLMVNDLFVMNTGDTFSMYGERVWSSGGRWPGYRL
jgi:hypothetical protein